MYSAGRRKNISYHHIGQANILFIALTSFTMSIIITQFAVECSPPVDFFVYTSQPVNRDKPEKCEGCVFGSMGPLIPQSLKSLYSPSTSNTNPDSKNESHYLDELSKKVLSLVLNASHTHDNDLIDLDTTRYAWHLMEKQALIYMRKRVATLNPFIEGLLEDAKVSSDCQKAIKDWMSELKDLKSWATIMWNSWGDFPPAGVFEGSFTDLGSYRSCVNIEDNPIIGQAQYCTLDFQPLVPTRPRFHSIFKKILDVDPITNRITGGDFPVDKISSSHSAHTFSSSRFLMNATQPDQDDLVKGSKYLKRTIFQNGTETSDSNINMTMKSEALIELIRKAQYFYYVKFRMGACLPSKCSQDDVQKLAQAGGQRAILQADKVNCMKKEPFVLNGYQKTAIWILSVLALIAALGTVVDLLGYKANHDSSSLASWLLPFSIWTNSKRLFASDAANSHTDLECVHGLRFFSMIWVIYGHTILYTEYQAFTHFFEVVETQIPSFILLPTLNANFSVDTFFVISGILTTYVTWEYIKGDARKFNKLAFAISRYIRLTPQLAIVILCFFLLPLFGDGPLYKQVTEDKAQVCYDKWYLNLLYLQSYVNSDKLCIDPSWWLSIEMSFHLLSMVVIMVMIQNPSKGMVINFVMAAVLTTIGAIIHYTNRFAIQYLPSIPQRYEVASEQSQIFFHRPYPHAASYFIGIALGYVLANKTVKKLSKSQVYQGWFACAACLIISLWGSYYWNLGYSYSQLQATLYYNICQVLWPLSIAWIILACSLGHGGFVQSILSARCFIPMGRITYMTYLSHALIIYYHSASLSIPIEPSMMLFIYVFIANTFLAMILGVVLTVVYESPILNLQKQLFTYLTNKFDPVSNSQMREIPRTIVCEKNGNSPASAMLLPKKSNVLINGTGNGIQMASSLKTTSNIKDVQT